MNNKFLYFIILILSVFCILSVKKCNENRENLKTEKGFLEQALEQIKSSNGVITKQKTLITTDYDLIKKMAEEITVLRNKKRVKEVVKVKETFYLKDTILLDSVVYLKDSTIMKPFSKRNPHYLLQGRVFDSTLYIDSLVIPNKITIAKELKGGIWKKKQYVYVHNSNPYITVDSMNNVSVVEVDTKFNRFVKTTGKIGVGILIGILIK